LANLWLKEFSGSVKLFNFAINEELALSYRPALGLFTYGSSFIPSSGVV
jgi:hypothetical protein